MEIIIRDTSERALCALGRQLTPRGESSDAPYSGTAASWGVPRTLQVSSCLSCLEMKDNQSLVSVEHGPLGWEAEGLSMSDERWRVSYYVVQLFHRLLWVLHSATLSSFFSFKNPFLTTAQHLLNTLKFRIQHLGFSQGPEKPYGRLRTISCQVQGPWVMQLTAMRRKYQQGWLSWPLEGAGLLWSPLIHRGTVSHSAFIQHGVPLVCLFLHASFYL